LTFEKLFRNAVPRRLIAMSDNVVYLHGKPKEIAQVTRVGFREHGLCEHLLSANKLTSNRFVLDAATEGTRRHKSLVRSLKDRKAEIILDTNCAELSVVGRFSGSAKSVPWAVEGRALETEDFAPGTNRSVIEPIARYAVKNEFPVVLSPSHFLGGNDQDWRKVDFSSCEALRRALDQCGGNHILIDYPIIASYAQFRDPNFRKSLRDDLRNLPIDRIWLRIAGFGANATGVGISRIIEGSVDFHELDIPIIADFVGGITSLAVSALGGVSGFACGLEGKQQFQTSGWLKPDSGGGGGQSKRVFISSLDRFLSVSEMREFFDNTRTSRQLFGCSDATCCGDVDKMLRNPEAHMAVQTGRLVKSLSEIPETLRAEQFLENHLLERVKIAGRANRIKNMDDDLRKKIGASAKKLELTYEALSGLHDRMGSIDFPAEAKFRSGARQSELFQERSS
jgi:hypothetical protein